MITAKPQVVCTSSVLSTPPFRLPSKKKYHFRACDLFAGAGGFSEGLRQAGFKVVVSNEIDPAAVATYRANHPETILIEGDVTLKETKDAIVAACGKKPIDLLVGGVPCQSFSVASSKRKGMQDPRGQLWFAYMDILQRLKPSLAVAENVPGLLSYPEALKSILSIFNHLGYYAEFRVLSASEFGVPQERKRLLFVASRVDWQLSPIIWPQPQFAPTAEKGVEQ